MYIPPVEPDIRPAGLPPSPQPETMGPQGQEGMMGGAVAWADVAERTIIPGFHGKFIHSGHMSFALWRLEAGAILPPHEHPHEQVVHVFSGELEIFVAGARHRCTPGTVLVIPPGARHHGTVLAEASVMDVFSPVREDYRDGGATVLGGAASG